MKLKEYLDNLNALVKERPESLDFDVVTSSDDEGNGYNLVYYTPQVGNYDSEEKHFVQEITTNAVCVN